jgi:hypothetical protein
MRRYAIDDGRFMYFVVFICELDGALHALDWNGFSRNSFSVDQN